MTRYSSLVQPILAVVLLASACIPLQAPSTPPPDNATETDTTTTFSLDGAWEGLLQVAGMELAIIVEFVQDGNQVVATIDIPAQGAEDVPMHDIRVDLPSVHLELLEGPQLATFDGELADDGVLRGTFKQSGAEGSFELAQADEATAEAKASTGEAADEGAGENEEARYEDPGGLFTVPIPTNWTAEQADGFAVLASPDNGITIYVMTLPGDDLEASIAQAWALVDPDFELPVDEVVDQPVNRIERAVNVVYETDDENLFVIGSGMQHEGISYLQLVVADLVSLQKRTAQAGIVLSGFDILAVEETDLSGIQPREFDDALAAEFEAYIESALERFGVPGAAVAVVQDGEVVYASGFGERDPETGALVTPETQMMIGSTTKTMTTMLMATLVDDGSMDWDTPVVEIIPTFAVADPELSGTLSVSNLVCACTGVPRRDYELIFNANNLTAEDVIESLADFEFFTDFGEAFQYSNQMVAAGGYVAAAAAGGEYGELYEAYESAMRERVLDPIDMADTTLDFEEVQARGNFATPHGLDLGFDYSPIPMEVESFVTPIAPAGAYWSTVNDMARYLITELNGGVSPDGTRVVSAENLGVTWEPQVPIAADTDYGLGWLIGDYRGQPVISHGGNTGGFTSDLAFLPEAGVGISVLTNARVSNFFNEAVRYRLLELLFDQESEVDEGAMFGYTQLQEAFGDMAGKIVDELDIEVVSPYVGDYHNDALGEMTVELVDDKLYVDAGEFRAQLHPKVDDDGEPDGYIIYDAPMTGATMDLVEDDAGKPTIILGAGVVEYVFEQ